MSFNDIRENKIPAKISGFTVGMKPRYMAAHVRLKSGFMQMAG